MPIYSMGFVVAIAAVAFYYQAGEKEMDWGLPWAGLSAVISAVVLLIMSYLVFVKGLELQFPLLPKFMTK